MTTRGDVAQPGRAPGLQPGGRRFKSDHLHFLARYGPWRSPRIAVAGEYVAGSNLVGTAGLQIADCRLPVAHCRKLISCLSVTISRSRAHSSARLERIPDKDEVPGSNPGGPTEFGYAKLLLACHSGFEPRDEGLPEEPTNRKIQVGPRSLATPKSSTRAALLSSLRQRLRRCFHKLVAESSPLSFLAGSQSRIRTE